MNQRRLFYALGGGLGHLTRTLALARRLAADDDSENLILTNSPFASVIIESGFELPANLRINALPAYASKAELTKQVPQLIQRFQPHLLVVDTFPRGLVGEMVELISARRSKQVFVHRYLNEDYVRKFDLANFVDHFDQIIVPGESAPLESHPKAIRTEPWLLLDDGELLSRKMARQQLNADDRPLVLVSGSGRPTEVTAAEETAEALSARFSAQANIRFASPENPEHWPLLQLLNGVDLLVGGGGYNTVHEARSTSTPLLALTQKRLYDRQDRRVAGTERVRNFDELINQISKILMASSADGKFARYQNGVMEASELLGTR